MSAVAVLADAALQLGVEGMPHDLALWASAEPGVLGQLGAEALASQTLPTLTPASWKKGCKNGGGSWSWTHSRNFLRAEGMTSSRTRCRTDFTPMLVRGMRPVWSRVHSRTGPKK